MSLIKKSDVKNHLSPQFRTKIFLCPPVSQPDATGYSVAEPGAIKAISANFAEDFVKEHSSSGVAVVPADPMIDSTDLQVVAVSKSAQP
jgi:hypothetical protein